MMSVLLTIFCFVVYFLSIFGVIYVYGERDMSVTFWSFVFILIPFVNTIIFIILFDDWDVVKDFFSLKRFFNELKQ